MESIVCVRPFAGSIDEMVARCRSLDSRKLWPGATVDAEIPGTLFYTLGIRLKSAAMTDMHVEERLGPVEADDDGVVFESIHRCTWPDLVVDARSRYRFRPGDPHSLEFTYSYDRPGAKIVKAKNLPAFHTALGRVIDRYLDQLTIELQRA